jgi:hypothetical protein
MHLYSIAVFNEPDPVQVINKRIYYGTGRSTEKHKH